MWVFPQCSASVGLFIMCVWLLNATLLVIVEGINSVNILHLDLPKKGCSPLVISVNLAFSWNEKWKKKKKKFSCNNWSVIYFDLIRYWNLWSCLPRIIVFHSKHLHWAQVTVRFLNLDFFQYQKCICTQQDYYDLQYGTLLQSYCTCTSTEVTALLLWSISAVTMACSTYTAPLLEYLREYTQRKQWSYFKEAAALHLCTYQCCNCLIGYRIVGSFAV